MAKVKLSDYIAKYLKEKYKVDCVFMVSGGGAMHLNDSFGKFIPYVCNHHEQACAISAEGYARINQKLAVVNVTTGPGGLNCLNGVFGQWTDSVPVLYISGQVKRATMMSTYNLNSLRQLGDQEVDIVSTVKPLTKYAVTVTEPDEIKYHLDKAIYLATTGRFGPVWLDIPIDVQSSVIDEEDLKEFIPPIKEKTELKIKEVIEKINNAKRPLIIAGHGIRLSGQIENFKSILEKLNIPTVTTLNGFDMLETTCSGYIGRIGSVGQRAGNFALQNADLILCLGTRNNVRQVSYNWENFAKNAYKIMVDIDKAELDKPLVAPDLKINANLSDFIPVFKDEIGKIKNDYSEWFEFCKNMKVRYSFEKRPEIPQKEDIIEPYHFIYMLTKQMKENDIGVFANGSAIVCTFQNAIVKKNQRFLMNSGNASMGYALPASIGAYYSAKDRNIICVEGDGSIMMNLQELQTIVHNKIPVKIFVINNSGYSSIRQSQRNFFNGNLTACSVDSGVSVPDFSKIGTAFGIKTIKITSPKTMEEDIKTALNYDGVILCEVMTEKEYSFLPKLSSKTLPDGTIISPSLEDMYPFLNRAEFEENILK